MSTAVPGQSIPPAQPAPVWQPAAPQPAPPARAEGSVLRRWPAWAQNTALAVGAVAVLVVVFFAGFFTANAVDAPRGGFGTTQDFRQFGNGGGSGSGNGFGGQSGSGDGFGGQSGSGSGTGTGSGS